MVGGGDEGKDANGIRVSGRETKEERDGAKSIKGNECHSVFPALRSRCLCQLSRSPSRWGEKIRRQCQTPALLLDSAGTMTPTRDHRFVDKELQLLQSSKSRDQGGA